jgi:hypothetical protein
MIAFLHSTYAAIYTLRHIFINLLKKSGGLFQKLLLFPYFPELLLSVVLFTSLQAPHAENHSGHCHAKKHRPEGDVGFIPCFGACG